MKNINSYITNKINIKKNSNYVLIIGLTLLKAQDPQNYVTKFIKKTNLE